MSNYGVTFAGTASPALRASFADLSVTSSGDATTLSGRTLDEAGLPAVIERVQSLGLTILDVHLIDQGPGAG
jgi:hypothetical protein